MKFIDKLSAGLAILSGVMVFVLIGVMIFEVVSRYVFGAPTLWAGDMTYMLGGALFMLASAYGLQVGGHVSIDFIAMALPERLRQGILAALYAFAALPTFGMLTWVATNKTISAFQNGTADPVSAFAPKLWPFYTALTLGLAILFLQIAVTMLRALGKASGRHG